jgi:Animal haem peroxidase
MMTSLGCASARVNNVEQPLSAEATTRLGCRRDDKMDAALIAEDAVPERFEHAGVSRLKRAHKTTRNNVTAWWDASQIYGFDARSLQRVRRDPTDSAKLQMLPGRRGDGEGERFGYLPVFGPVCLENATSQCDAIRPEWAGQESVAFPDNWSIGLSFLHNLFVREHNIVVDAFRKMAGENPSRDSGLRNPDRPSEMISYSQISDEELFAVARLIVSAEIAKIHTIEWTPQLLYDEPLYLAMNSNWSGLFDDFPPVADALEQIVRKLGESSDGKERNQLFSALVAGGGIVGLGNTRRDGLVDRWDLTNPDEVNGGVNHFGSPFNFPEEFVSVYRLHPMIPDMLEFREVSTNPMSSASGSRSSMRSAAKRPPGCTRAGSPIGLSQSDASA